MESLYRALINGFRTFLHEEGTLDLFVLLMSSALKVNASLVSRIIEKESGWNPSAVSPTGAIGLGQITSPALADFNSVFSFNLKKEDMHDPLWNAFVTAWYISHVATLAGHDPMTDDIEAWAEIYAAYNVGYGSLRKLRSGHYDSSLRRLIGYQANALREGGPERYLDNVKAFLSAEVV